MGITDETFYGRVDKGSAQNDAINLDNQEKDVITFTFTNVATDGSPSGNTLELQTDPITGLPIAGSEDINTIINISGGTIDGVSLSGSYNFTVSVVGTLPTSGADTNKFPATFQGSTVYILELTDNYNTPTDNDAPLNGSQPIRIMFMPFEDPILDATATALAGFKDSGAIGLNNSTTTPPPTCFLVGSVIETRAGGRPVETLETGDEVAVAGGGFAHVAWVSSSLHAWDADSDASTKPVSFRAGSLGTDAPSQELIVSPQHHMLMSGPVVADMFGVEEVLAPAKGLTGLPGVRVMQGKRAAEYYHVMLERHEIIMAHGVATESFYPGPNAVRMLTPAQRASLYGVVPALKTDPENGYGPTARKKITRREAEKLVAAILADRKAKAIAAE